MEALQSTWFILLFVLLGGYAMLDGFDLGVGVLHLTGKTDDERRVGLNAIGPVWDGNEVWLVTAGGALFAAFPYVYATVFSAMYLALMLVLVALIMRAVSIEFRSKVESRRWRGFWDVCFFLGSLLPAILFGVAFGNILRGLPINEVNGQLRFVPGFFGGFFDLLNPYSVFIGILSLALFTMHGSIYLAGKTQGAQQERLRRQALPLWMAVLLLYVIATGWTLGIRSELFNGLDSRPVFWVMMAVLGAGLIVTPGAIYSRKWLLAFMGSSAMILGMMGLSAVSLYPNLVPSTMAPVYNLTIFNSSSTAYTLKTMLIIALIGMPLVIAYTIAIYVVFKGKVKIGHDSY